MTLFSIRPLYSVATYSYVNDLETPRLKLTDTQTTNNIHRVYVLFYKQISMFLKDYTLDTEGDKSYALKCSMYMETQRLRKPMQNLFPKADMKTVPY